MHNAILLASGTGIDEEKLSSFGDVVFGAVPQIKRLIITAQRSGITCFSIITEKVDSKLKELLSNDKRITSKIEWIELGSNISLSNSTSLIIQSNLVTTPEALSDFMNQKTRNDEIVLLVDDSKDAFVKTKNNKIDELYLSGGRAVGALLASGKILEKSIMDSMSLKSLVVELIGRDKVRYTKFKDGYWMRLSSDKNSAKKAEDLLFSYVGKTATGRISRNINSKISLPTSRLLIRTPLTPNMISILINIIGVLSGPFYALGHPVLGAMFLEVATILDRCDGEVARVKLLETKRGQWIDTISDQFTVFSFIVGLSIGYYFESKNHLAIYLGIYNVGVFVFFLVWSIYFLKRYTNSGSLVSYFDVDKIVGEKNRTIVHKLILFVRPMSRRNFYSLGLLVVAIIGGYPWVLGILTFALTLFLLHLIEDIIKIKKLQTSDS